MGTDLDTLVIGNCYLKKENQNIELKKDYKNKYELD
jgi:carbamoyltransferase